MHKLLLDHCVPAGLTHHLTSHTVSTAAREGWQALQNGKLLQAAETEGFDILITTDKGFTHQQNMQDRKISVIVISAITNRLPDLLQHLPALLTQVGLAEPGHVYIVGAALV